MDIHRTWYVVYMSYERTIGDMFVYDVTVLMLSIPITNLTVIVY